ncbi:MAG: phosphomethylpyrimidine synthase ThiC [Candidatus Auribacterota bacterium]|jgi:phosphomethylpyrimidine synthase|nr:phosphomethylpyrimidine synthase ThiC [Candidatus Auribacterota bacterium]
MTTQLEAARDGVITKAMEAVAQKEGFTPQEIRSLVADGSVVIPVNTRRLQTVNPIGIGERLLTKINANIGTSQSYPEVEYEIEKLEIALCAGADAVMDLSTGGDLHAIRQAILDRCSVPVGTVPIYELMVKHKADFSIEKYLDIIRDQAQQGVDFFTIHAGVLRSHIADINNRLMGVVSRGGAYLVSFMKRTGQENPLYERFDDILEICRTYDVTISLGDGLRPGCINDATDRAQISELEVLGVLANRCREAGVQVMIEGPGHVPLDQIQRNMELKTQFAGSTPFYVLGPLVTDVAPGYDHICGAIGGTLAAYWGASFLCYLTPREHLGLPTVTDVREGVVASRIAAHAADLARGKAGARQWDNAMAKARIDFDWEKQFELAIDPQKARERKDTARGSDSVNVCSMCGDYCSMKLTRES